MATHSHKASTAVPFRLDINNQCLWHGAKKITLTPKAFAILQVLMEHREQLVTKDTLLNAVWPDVYVNDGTLKVYIRRLRLALGDNPDQPRCIETVPWRGYRFIGEVISSQQAEGWREGKKQKAGSTEQKCTLSLQPQASNPKPQTASLVGRKTELEQLHNWLEHAVQGDHRIVFLTGEPGIGKTALINTFLATVAADTRLWMARGECVEHYGTGEAYLPILDALERLCRIPGHERLIPLLRQHAPMWLAQLPSLIGPTERQRLRREIQGVTPERMGRELAGALTALTTEIPLILVLEDLHWSDAATLDLLLLLARRHELRRFLLLGTYRSTTMLSTDHPLKATVAELYAHQQCKELPLPFLDTAAVREYLHYRLAREDPNSALPLHSVAQAIHQRTDGNALFMVNVVDHLLTMNDLDVNSQALQSTNSLCNRLQAEVPLTIQRMIEAQIDRLPPDEQRLLEIASLAGTTFVTAAVAAGLGAAPLLVEEQCAELARQGYFLKAQGETEWPDGTVTARYEFIHSLYQNILSERVPAGKRAHIQLRIGEREEQGYGGQPRQIAAGLAVRFEQGRDYSRAVEYLLHAAENATSRGGYREAAHYYTRGLTLLALAPHIPAREKQEFALQTGLGLALQASQGFATPEAGRALTRAWELRQQAETGHEQFQVVRGLYSFYQARGALAAAHELAQHGLQLAQQLQDIPLLLCSRFMVGATLLFLGELTAARTTLEDGLAQVDLEHDPLLQTKEFSPTAHYATSCLHTLATVLLRLGYPEQALQKRYEAFTLAQQQPSVYPFVRYGVSQIYSLRGDWEHSQHWAEATISLAIDEGLPQWVAIGTLLRGKALVEREQIREGLAQMREGITHYHATGAVAGSPFYRYLLAEACVKAEHWKEAFTIMEEATKVAEEEGQQLIVAAFLWLKGRLLLQQYSREQGTASIKQEEKSQQLGKDSKEQKSKNLDPQSHIPDPSSEAEACFHQAIAMARAQQAKMLELQVTTSLARVWQQQALEHGAKSREQGARSQALGVRSKKQAADAKLTEAHQMLSEVYGWFTEGFETKDLQEAKALLDELCH